MIQKSLAIFALAVVSTTAWAQVSVEEFLQARKDNGITSALNSVALREFTGTKVFEVRCNVKGFIASRGETLMVETPDGIKLNIRSAKTPAFIKQSLGLVRLMVRLDRQALGSIIDAELVLATEDGPIAEIDAKAAAEAEAREAKLRRKSGYVQPGSRAGSRKGAPTAAPSDIPSLKGPIGGDPERDQQVLDVAAKDPATIKAGTAAPSAPEPLSNGMAYVVGAYATYMQETNSRLERTDAEAWAKYIIQYSNEVGLDARLMIALVTAESDFHWRETSNKGAMGLAQLMPDEVQRFGVTNAYDPGQNIRAACMLLREGIDKYKGLGFNDWDSMVLALAGYNAGHGAVKKYGYKVPPYRETQNYVAKITRMYKKFTGLE